MLSLESDDSGHDSSHESAVHGFAPLELADAESEVSVANSAQIKDSSCTNHAFEPPTRVEASGPIFTGSLDEEIIPSASVLVSSDIDTATETKLETLGAPEFSGDVDCRKDFDAALDKISSASLEDNLEKAETELETEALLPIEESSSSQEDTPQKVETELEAGTLPVEESSMSHVRALRAKLDAKPRTASPLPARVPSANERRYNEIRANDPEGIHNHYLSPTSSPVSCKSAEAPSQTREKVDAQETALACAAEDKLAADSSNVSLQSEPEQADFIAEGLINATSKPGRLDDDSLGRPLVCDAVEELSISSFSPIKEIADFPLQPDGSSSHAPLISNAFDSSSSEISGSPEKSLSMQQQLGRLMEDEDVTCTGPTDDSTHEMDKLPGLEDVTGPNDSTLGIDRTTNTSTDVSAIDINAQVAPPAFTTALMSSDALRSLAQEDVLEPPTFFDEVRRPEKGTSDMHQATVMQDSDPLVAPPCKPSITMRLPPPPVEGLLHDPNVKEVDGEDSIVLEKTSTPVVKEDVQENVHRPSGFLGHTFEDSDGSESEAACESAGTADIVEAYGNHGSPDSSPDSTLLVSPNPATISEEKSLRRQNTEDWGSDDSMVGDPAELKTREKEADILENAAAIPEEKSLQRQNTQDWGSDDSMVGDPAELKRRAREADILESIRQSVGSPAEGKESAESQADQMSKGRPQEAKDQPDVQAKLSKESELLGTGYNSDEIRLRSFQREVQSDVRAKEIESAREDLIDARASKHLIEQHELPKGLCGSCYDSDTIHLRSLARDVRSKQHEHGRCHLKVAHVLLKLAICHHKQGSHDACEEAFDQVKTICKDCNVFGCDVLEEHCAQDLSQERFEELLSWIADTEVFLAGEPDKKTSDLKLCDDRENNIKSGVEVGNFLACNVEEVEKLPVVAYIGDDDEDGDGQDDGRDVHEMYGDRPKMLGCTSDFHRSSTMMTPDPDWFDSPRGPDIGGESAKLAPRGSQGSTITMTDSVVMRADESLSPGRNTPRRQLETVKEGRCSDHSAVPSGHRDDQSDGEDEESEEKQLGDSLETDNHLSDNSSAVARPQETQESDASMRDSFKDKPRPPPIETGSPQKTPPSSSGRPAKSSGFLACLACFRSSEHEDSEDEDLSIASGDVEAAENAVKAAMRSGNERSMQQSLAEAGKAGVDAEKLAKWKNQFYEDRLQEQRNRLLGKTPLRPRDGDLSSDPRKADTLTRSQESTTEPSVAAMNPSGQHVNGACKMVEPELERPHQNGASPTHQDLVKVGGGEKIKSGGTEIINEKQILESHPEFHEDVVSDVDLM